MQTKLTMTEGERAARVVSNMEQRARRWPRRRMLRLAIGSLYFVTGIFLFIHLMACVPHLIPWRSFMAPQAPVDYQGLEGVMRANVSMLGQVILQSVLTALVFIGGGTLLGVTIFNWHRDRKDALLAKVLRSAVQGTDAAAGDA